MKLYLQVTSKDRYYLGDKADFIIGPEGGSIGRAAGADWVIDDSSRFMSSLHLTIDQKGGQFFITDRSTNGTFRDYQRLVPGVTDPRPLYVGEELSLGQIKIKVVSIDTGLSTLQPDMQSNMHSEGDDDTHLRGSERALSGTSQLGVEHDDHASLLKHQARLADLIANSFPDVDHGEGFNLPEFKPGIPSVASKPRNELPRNDLPQDALPLHDASQVQDELLKLILIQVQQQLVRDRISSSVSSANGHLLQQSNIFHRASSASEILNGVADIKHLKRDVQAALSYLLQANNNEDDE